MAKHEASGETAEPNTLKDQWGEERDWDPERYPEGSPAREGKITRPSGQGGMTPKARPDHQDMFPANPEASDAVKAAQEENRRIEQGEVSRVNPDPSTTKPAKTSAPKAEERKS